MANHFDKILKENIERIFLPLVGDKRKLRKYLQQLTVLSRLRNLEVQTKKLIDDMPIHYDITKDGLYLEGLQIGRQEAQQVRKEAQRAIKNAREDAKKAAEKAQKESKKQTLLEVITELLQKPDMTVERIARVTRVSISYVRKIHAQLSKKR